MAITSIVAPSVGGLVPPISGTISLQQTLTSSGSVTIPANITRVFAICVGGGAGGYSSGGGGQSFGGPAATISFGVTAPATSVTIGAGGVGYGLANGLWGGVGGYTTYGAISAGGGGNLQFDGSGVARQWIRPGTKAGSANGSNQSLNGSTNFCVGGWSVGAGGGAGGNGGFNLQYTSYNNGTYSSSPGAGVAGNASANNGGLGGGGGPGTTPAYTTTYGGAGIVYLYY